MKTLHRWYGVRTKSEIIHLLTVRDETFTVSDTIQLTIAKGGGTRTRKGRLKTLHRILACKFSIYMLDLLSLNNSVMNLDKYKLINFS